MKKVIIKAITKECLKFHSKQDLITARIINELDKSVINNIKNTIKKQNNGKAYKIKIVNIDFVENGYNVKINFFTRKDENCFSVVNRTEIVVDYNGNRKENNNEY